MSATTEHIDRLRRISYLYMCSCGHKIIGGYSHYGVVTLDDGDHSFVCLSCKQSMVMVMSLSCTLEP